MPCLTTPAPDEKGRSAPKRRKHDRPEDQDTLARWSADGQQFAPWHYRKHQMVTTDGHLTLPSVNTKQAMHELPFD